MNIGLCVCGSFCTLSKTLIVVERLINKGHTIYPILSFSVNNTDTRFFKANDFIKKITTLTGHEPITTIVDAEPIGPNKPFDLILSLPTTGNTLSKLACGTTDTPVTMAIKAHLRNLKPVVLSIATNDGLSQSLPNIATLLNRKNIYFVPFKQDDPISKPNSLIADTDLVEETIACAMIGKQLMPVI